MSELNPSQRQILIDALAAWLRENLADAHNEVELHMVRGVEADFRDDLLEPRLSHNDTATLTIRINGGARDTQIE